MQLHGAVIPLVGAIMALPTWLFVNLFSYSMSVGRWDPAILVIPGAVLALIIAVAFGFAFERRRALRMLTDLLEGEPSSAGS